MARFNAMCAGVVLACSLGTAASLPVEAHHSFAATYDNESTVTIQGTVTQFLYRNPHSFVHVMVKDPKSGQYVEWAIEWAAQGALTDSKVQENTLQPGDVVIITGNPGRHAASHRMRMRAVVRPSDGWKWAGTFG